HPEEHRRRRPRAFWHRAVDGEHCLVVSLDDQAVLTIDCSVPEGSGSTSAVFLGMALRWGRTIEPSASAVRLVDLPGGRVWDAGRGATRSTSTYDLGWLHPGESIAMQTFFGPVDVDHVDVLLPFFGLVPDVPVVKGDASTPDVTSLGHKGPFELPGPQLLERYVLAYDGDTSVQQSGDDQMVTLASDVLFATDDFSLSPEALGRVDSIAGQIAAVASGGQVQVVGHTDDVASDEYNLELSKKRARSVADRMAPTLGAAFTFVVDGKGKREPAVSGTDPAARAANRRVEISFSASEALELAPQTQPVPPPTGPTAVGHNTVEFVHSLPPAPQSVTVTVAVTSVVRRHGYLIGTLEITLVDGRDMVYILGEYYQEQRYAHYAQVHGAWDVALLGPAGRVHPVQYPYAGSRDRFPRIDILADRFRWNRIDVPGSFTYTVVWPDTGQDKVSVDVRNRFRITDIPVEIT
ncbi:MAG: OmpA family protein, partial [Micrococcales bacterium]|nr:OmpA family protein [Micrococcales bacterium]